MIAPILAPARAKRVPRVSRSRWLVTADAAFVTQAVQRRAPGRMLRLHLPLRAGDHELAVLVSDSFGGWGIMGRLPASAGVTVEAR